MAVSQITDITTQFNSNSGDWNLDIDSWDFVVVQLVDPTGAVSFLTSNDAGAIQGSGDGNAIAALNFTAVQGTNLATGSGVTSLAVTGLVKFSGIGRFLRLESSATAAKVLVRWYKIC